MMAKNKNKNKITNSTPDKMVKLDNQPDSNDGSIIKLERNRDTRRTGNGGTD
jgi:hypothetical protein